MGNFERKERGTALINEASRPNGFEEAKRMYIEDFDAGDEYDERSTIVDMLTDIGHVIGHSDNGLGAALAGTHELDDVNTAVQAMLDAARANEHNVDAIIWSVSNHLDAERASAFSR